MPFVSISDVHSLSSRRASAQPRSNASRVTLSSAFAVEGLNAMRRNRVARLTCSGQMRSIDVSVVCRHSRNSVARVPALRTSLKMSSCFSSSVCACFAGIPLMTTSARSGHTCARTGAARCSDHQSE
jgi:hypothetical protein